MDLTLKEEKLFYDQVKKLSENTIRGIAASLINASIMVAVLWGVVNKNSLLLWISGIILISFLHICLQKNFKKVETTTKLINRWKNFFLVILAVTGLLWGSAAIILFPVDSISHQAFIAFVIGGMVAGSVGVFSVMLSAFLVFSIPAFFPIIVKFYLIGGQIHFAMGTMVSLFWLIMLMTAKGLNRDILNYFSLKYENIDLISELKTEVNVRKKVESDLKTKNIEIEKIVDKRTSEIQETNKKLTGEIEERRIIADALQKSEEKYRDLVEDINDVIYSTDENGIITYISPTVTSSLGYDPQEIIGKTFSDYVHKDDLDYLFERFQQILAGNLSPGEYRLRSKMNDYHWIQASSRPIMKNGHFAGLRGSFTDISEKKNLEERLRQSLKMEAIGTLAGGIAHEFNNVLAIIIGNSELALHDIPDSNPSKIFLEEILTASFRAKEVVREILSFARQSKPEHKPINIAENIKGELKLLRASIPSTIEMRLNIADKTGTVLGDPTQINQVLMNLCTNSVDSMSEDGGILEISLEDAKVSSGDKMIDSDLADGNYAKLTIRDTGHGIDAEDIHRIFDPYYTTKEVGKGTGMGLAVVHGIVKAHGGGIRVSSRLNRGTIFEIFFPKNPDSIEPETKIDKETPKGTERILFVDDEEAIVNVNKQQLERLGYQVEFTTNPLKALELFRSHPDRYNLIITDMTMPQITGDKLAEKLMKIRPDIPVILCTGYSEKMTQESVKKIGIRKLIEKPIDRSELAMAIRSALEESQ
ncbi:MAG: PAS domain S-box protein [Desulfobacterales bacterium]